MTEKYSTADVRRAWHDATCPEGEECPDREVHALAFESMSVALELFLDYLPDAPAAVVAPKVAPKSSTEPTEEYLVKLLREHNFDRLVCYDHESGSCDPAGCHDLRITQEEHYARLLSALLPQRVAPSEEEVAKAILMVTQGGGTDPDYAWSVQFEEVQEELLEQSRAIAALYASAPTVAEVRAQSLREAAKDAESLYVNVPSLLLDGELTRISIAAWLRATAERGEA